jgi:Xaa-Pro aminopeptidase
VTRAAHAPPRPGDESPIATARSDRRPLFDATRLKSELERAGLDVLLACSNENVTYTGGALIQTPVLPTIVLTEASGAQAVIVNEADVHVFEQTSWISDVRGYPFLDKPGSESLVVQLLGDLLDERGLRSARIGIDEDAVSWTMGRKLEQELGQVTWVNAGEVYARTRMIKTPAEIALLRRAAEQTDRAIAHALAALEHGDTELELARAMQAHVLRLEAEEISHAHIQFGQRSTIAHTISAEVPCRPGDIIHIDFGGKFQGYTTDISRNAIVGSPSPRQASIYAALAEIQAELFEAVRPGVVASELRAHADELFARHDLHHPWATLGHSVGLAMHECFEITPADVTLIAENMVLALEPTHIEAGDARYDLEDMILVTAHGVERLSTVSDTESLFVVD